MFSANYFNFGVFMFVVLLLDYCLDENGPCPLCKSNVKFHEALKATKLGEAFQQAWPRLKRFAIHDRPFELPYIVCKAEDSKVYLFEFSTDLVLQAIAVFPNETLAQRRSAVIVGNNPAERSIQFRRNGYPGLASADLSTDQRRLVEAVMREILAPYRAEDADEVMALVRRNGGLERLHLAFYRDRGATDASYWHFWRIAGPGFVWNYRVLPHVHCYVNIGRAPQA